MDKHIFWISSYPKSGNTYLRSFISSYYFSKKGKFNFDLLLRYVINPWSAFYIGYNTNQSNFDIVEMEGERELVVANDLRQDGDQVFIKFSYLFQR